jgi:hypothetical protein
MQKSKILFLVFIFSFQEQLPITFLSKNEKCPIAELYKEPNSFTYRFKWWCLNKLTYRAGYFYEHFPQEMIERADKKDVVEVNENLYLLLKAQSDKNKSILNQSLFSLALAVTKKIFLGESPSFFEEEKVDTQKKTIGVTEYAIASLLPFVQLYNCVDETNPPGYTFLINDEGKSFRDEITSVISDYEYFSRLLQLGWIRCSGPGYYFRPRYFKQESVYQKKYGPPFREIMQYEEPRKGSEIKSYVFQGDPAYN